MKWEYLVIKRSPVTSKKVLFSKLEATTTFQEVKDAWVIKGKDNIKLPFEVFKVERIEG